MADAQAEGQKVLYLCISLGLVLMAGLMSGLTLGLMSLDQVDLEVCKHATSELLQLPMLRIICAYSVALLHQVLLRSGTPTEKRYAARISPVRLK